MRNNQLVCTAVLALCLGCGQLCAQQQFKASQGLSTALSNARSGGLPNAKLTAIATLGDTTFFGAFVPDLVKRIIRFDAAKGTSSFWGYRFTDRVGGTDTSAAYIVTKILTYLAVPAPIPDLPSLPIVTGAELPTSFMDSDTMSARILATNAYQSYIRRYPAARFQAVALGTSVGGVFPTGPLWVAFIGDHPQNPSLNCFVEATNNSGSATCIETAATEVADGADAHRPTVYPNPVPANTDVTVHIPLTLYSPHISLNVYTVLGQHVRTYALRDVAGGVDIRLGLDHLQSGPYMIRLDNGGTNYCMFFTIE